MQKMKKLLVLAGFLVCVLGAASPAWSFTAQRIVIPYTTLGDAWWSGLALHNEGTDKVTVMVTFYNEGGEVEGGKCVSMDPQETVIDILQNFADPGEVPSSGSYSVYIRSLAAWSQRFSATLFVGNTGDTMGFGFQTFTSVNYETNTTLMCLPPVIIIP